jgi:hypothetical protein
MVMVTRINTNNNNQENVLKEYFQRIAETHSELKMKQDHVDVSQSRNIKKTTFFSSISCVLDALSFYN